MGSAGKDQANPGSVILAGNLMLAHLGYHDQAEAVERALIEVLKEGKAVTRDLNPESGAGTQEMTEAVLQKLGR